jgi:C-terminal processing protease CtpA/Prc
MESVSKEMEDDIEMLFAFYYYSGNLPMSHYSFMKPIPTDADVSEAYTPTAFLEEKDTSTAYLKITSFTGSAAEMDSIFDVVVKRGYRNLIVDLCNNPGGSVEAGMAFARRVADSTFYGGVFLTQRYFNSHKALPTVSEYTTFPHFTEANYDLLMEGIHNTEGVCLKVIPKAPAYRGKVFILTNGRTGSTCEPIVYGFKQNKRATVVGTTTAGAMLAAERFDLSNGFKIFLPTADYYTSDGFRIDKVGVKPDVDTGESDALQYVMDNLIKS